MKPRVWDPFYEILQLQDRTSRLFADNFGRASLNDAGMPAVDVYEEGDKLIVEAALPGFRQEDIEASLTDSGLEIKAEHQEQHENNDTKRNYLVRETSGRRFYRFVNMPTGARTNEATANFENGILRVEVPNQQQSEPKKLEIASTGRQEQDQQSSEN
jgi:HSP20 family protein